MALRRLFPPRCSFSLLAGVRVPAISAALLFFSALAEAQVFQLQGGSSSLFQAHGGSLQIRAPKYEGWGGLGDLEKMRVGAFLKTEYRGVSFHFGDEVLPLALPTDIFNSGQYFTVRGLGAARAGERFSWLSFAGTSSTLFATPYFRGARSEKGIGVFFADSGLTPSVRLFTRNVFSDQQTSISGLDWRPGRGLQVALAGGVGANQGYFASSLNLERDWLTLKASYSEIGERFRRIRVQTPLFSETDRENILVSLRPTSFITLTAGRNNFLQPSADGRRSERGTVNQYAIGLQAARSTFNATLLQSLVRGQRRTGTSFSVGRSFFERLTLNANVFHSRPESGPSATTVVGSVREVISPRFSLVQFVTHSQGNTTVSYGGNFLSNRLTIGVEYQTLYLPFLTGDQFKQALVLNLRFRPFGNLEVNGATFVRPDGATKYTVSGSHFFYGGALAGASPGPLTIPRFIIRGRVVNDEGQPIRGAALRIDGEVVFTDSQGTFFVRKPKPRSYRLTVLLEAFMVPGQFEIVQAPATATAATESRAIEIYIVLRRLYPPLP